MEIQTLAEVLGQNTKEGELYVKLEGDKVRCFACGHRCPIPEGKAGVCRVRFNKGGKLYVPSGYVGALQDDPIEKKPFFHALPGARALSFGMLGCDFHCGYCFLPSTRIATSEGVLPIREIVSQKAAVEVFTHTGEKRSIQSFFERPYHGPALRIKPAFLPSIECTPEHPFLARLRPDRYPNSEPEYVEAGKLTKEHCLVLPRHYSFSQESSAEDISSRAAEGAGKPAGGRSRGVAGTVARDFDSAIGGSSPPAVDDRLRSRASPPLLLRPISSGEPSSKRSESWLCRSLLPSEAERASEPSLAGARRTFRRQAFLPLKNDDEFSEEKLLTFFGDRGSCKKVPEALFSAKREVVQSFLNAYAAGDGYRAPDGHVRISTISEELAWGVAWLVQKLGYLPQFYQYPSVAHRQLLGRWIQQAPWTYLVRWYERPKKQRHMWEDERNRYVLIQKIEPFEYEGFVYNLEIEKDNTYLANFAAVHNCQNWVTSQALRDPVAGAPPAKVTPAEFIQTALERDCEVVASTYNEPLITSEWAVEIFKEAKQRGLVTAYISNGNGTPEVLDYIRPWVDLYKVDLKSFDDKHYRELGGTLENVCETIRGLYQRGFWLELLTLLIPGFNSSDAEIKKLTEFIASISPDIPWHVTAFHKDYKMTDPENTSAPELIRAAEIGKSAGLRYIYAGNLPGSVGNWENTYCPNCRELLIERYGFQILKDKLSPAGGQCFKCKTAVPGFWKKTEGRRASSNRIQPLL